MCISPSSLEIILTASAMYIQSSKTDQELYGTKFTIRFYIPISMEKKEEERRKKKLLNSSYLFALTDSNNKDDTKMKIALKWNFVRPFVRLDSIESANSYISSNVLFVNIDITKYTYRELKKFYGRSFHC